MSKIDESRPSSNAPSRRTDVPVSNAKAAAAGGTDTVVKPATGAAPVLTKSKNKFSVPDSRAPEFEVSAAPDWDPDAGSQGGGK